MMKRNAIYKCEDCGAVMEILTDCECEQTCCGGPMTLIEAKTADEGREKHLPVVEPVEGGVVVKVGSIPHPMQEEHQIEWVEVLTENRVLRKYLKPGQEPEARFDTDCKVVAVREHCNLHGLWLTEP